MPFSRTAPALYPSSPLLDSEPAPCGPQIFAPVRKLLAGLALAQALAACSLVGPAATDFEATGSIAAPPPAPRKPALPAALDEEDRRRALGALAIALDPQGNGTTVQWDNPVSKAHGSMTPTGFAYPENDLICRPFSAQFQTSSGPQSAQGSACRDKSAQWTLAELKLAKKD
jgi:hypothetical protein